MNPQVIFHNLRGHDSFLKMQAISCVMSKCVGMSICIVETVQMDLWVTCYIAHAIQGLLPTLLRQVVPARAKSLSKLLVFVGCS